MPQQQRGSDLRREDLAREGTILLFSKTVLSSHIRYKNEIILAPDGVSENGFLLERQLPFDERRFPR